MSLKTGAALLFLFFSVPVLAHENVLVEKSSAAENTITESTPLPSTNSPIVITDPLIIKMRPMRRVQYLSLDFGTVGAGRSVHRTVRFDGAQPGTEVEILAPKGASVPGASFTAWVSAKNQVTVRYMNTSNTVQTPGGSQTFRVKLK
jgi:hypothetical protein